ncbi:hypothetical protein [Dactylosporangium salmoneum]|uniref:Uncharacterized protein n=1 Tax=Dactylosporangium salmoneum TaxID=53361 RepID=A0ABP5TVG9_9ACTN
MAETVTGGVIAELVGVLAIGVFVATARARADADGPGMVSAPYDDRKAQEIGRHFRPWAR